VCLSSSSRVMSFGFRESGGRLPFEAASVFMRCGFFTL